MAEPIQRRIAAGPPLLFDGALGSRLIQMGLPAGKAPEAWIIDYPERIRSLHVKYVQAGSDVLTTCTFGANRLRLERGSLDARSDEINRRAVRLAKDATAEGCFVAGGMGPTGEFFRPHGTLTEAEARRIFEEQAAVLADEGVDFFLLETHYDLREARISLEACRNVAPHVPAAVTMTFNSTPRGFFTVMGDPAIAALQALADAGAFLVGSNCTLEAGGMTNLARTLLAELTTPLLFQPNAGIPQITADGIVYPQGPEEFAEYVEKILHAGARAIGGCCGSDATHIRALRKRIDAHFSARNS